LQHKIKCHEKKIVPQNRRVGLVAGVILLTRQLPANPVRKRAARVRLLRHAALLLEMNGKKLLVDPMLSAKEALDPIPNAASQARIPMVDLPFGEAELKQLLDEIDAVLVSHTHRDSGILRRSK
jgi:glyoxylase-like metal-dependent hydrolase (beta-lactamase superfamily II)